MPAGLAAAGLLWFWEVFRPPGEGLGEEPSLRADGKLSVQGDCGLCWAAGPTSLVWGTLRNALPQMSQGIRPEILGCWERLPQNSWWVGMTRIRGPEPPRCTLPGAPGRTGLWVACSRGASPKVAPFLQSSPKVVLTGKVPIARRMECLALDTALKASLRHPWLARSHLCS